MGVNQTADGRVNVGLGCNDINEYKGYAGRREIVIQLTANGATQDSLDALEFLKSYALYHNSVGEPIFPASTNVFISNNGVTKAVEADEVTVDGANVNIGGCAWNGTSWDFTNAGQGGGGGSSLPPVTSSDNGKVLAVKDGAWAATSNAYIITTTNGKSDKTVDEIHDAINMGRTVFLSLQGVTYAYSTEDSSRFYFLAYVGAATNIKVAYIAKPNLSASATTQPQLPATFSSDNGSVLIVKNGSWAKQKKKFIVTLTPTLADYSGTMDKTPAEITAAYEAGQDIEFDVPSMSVKCKAMEFAVNDGIIQAGAIVTYRSNGSHLLIEMLTHSTASEYFTSVYSLTPAS